MSYFDSLPPAEKKLRMIAFYADLFKALKGAKKPGRELNPPDTKVFAAVNEKIASGFFAYDDLGITEEEFMIGWRESARYKLEQAIKARIIGGFKPTPETAADIAEGIKAWGFTFDEVGLTEEAYRAIIGGNN